MGNKNKPVEFRVTPVRTDGVVPFYGTPGGRGKDFYDFSASPPIHRYTKAEIPDDACCTKCGWPLNSVNSSTVLSGTKRGDKKYAHQVCPSLSERRELRKQALENA